MRPSRACAATLWGSARTVDTRKPGWNSNFSEQRRTRSDRAWTPIPRPRVALSDLIVTFAALSLGSVALTRADPAGTLINPREFHTATRLLDGRVLLAGGLGQAGDVHPVLDSAEIYDPATNAWTPTGSLNLARYFHQAVLLADGRVLVADGRDVNGFPTKTVEIYDPAKRTWSFTKAMLNPPGGNLVLLADGRVLAAGGDEQKAANCELYDPSGPGTWSITGSLPSELSSWVLRHSVTRHSPWPQPQRPSRQTAFLVFVMIKFVLVALVAGRLADRYAFKHQGRSLTRSPTPG